MSRSTQTLAAIIATSTTGIIGNAGSLPWKLRSDLRRFKKLTMGGTLIMGRKTYESIGVPLLGRCVIVVSRGNPALINAGFASSPDEAVDLAMKIGNPIFVAGGAEIYKALLPKCDRLLWTQVYGEVEGDTRFVVPSDEFTPLAETNECNPASEGDSHDSSFYVWIRKEKSSE